jgi:hypothetical protein
MKKRYTILAFLLITASTFAQAPEKMSYQAVVRDATNTLVTNQSVGMQISILKGGVTETAVYVETQTPTTNTNGLVSLEIGTGTLISGDFTTIDWANDTYFIKTETDPIGGTTYTITGTSQLMSVPYALYAKTSGSSTPGPAGPSGATGAAGEKGETGTAGTNGTNGAKGDTGITGNVGAKGDTGDTGTTGNVGAKGDTGDTGTTGDVGAKGDTGDTGITGDVGAKGDTGDTGTTGDVGAKGDTGDTGITGDVGAKGDTGDTGTTGDVGAKGDTGTTGDVGPSGGGFIVTHISQNTTITTADQTVLITGAITVILPANPREGQIIYLQTNNKSASINYNGKTVKSGDQSYNGIETFDIWNKFGIQFVYSAVAGKWYHMRFD